MKSFQSNLFMKVTPVLLIIMLMTACVKISNIDPSDAIANNPHFATSVLASSSAVSGLQVFNVVGSGSPAPFNLPVSVARDANGNLYVADAAANRIMKINTTGNKSIFAGSGTPGSADGTGTAAQFNAPWGVAVDDLNNVLVADRRNHRIRKISPDGVVITIAGSDSGFTNGGGAVARFANPASIAYRQGKIYVGDIKNNCIRVIDNNNNVSTFAGTPKTGGYKDGPTDSARFYYPVGVAADANGTVYVADSGSYSIRKIASGQVTTLAGGTNGFADATGTSAKFSVLDNIAIDKAGNIIVADQGNNRIRQVTPAGVVTTLAGNGSSSDLIGPAASASIRGPRGITVDARGNAYVTTSSGYLFEIGNIIALAAGFQHSLFINTDQSVWATGYNIFGQLGDGTNIDKNTPVKIMDGVKAIAAGYFHSFFLKNDNSLWATGMNSFGQLGDGTTIDRNIPVKIMDGVLAVSAGYSHSLILKTDNTLWAVGFNGYGQLGDSTTTNKISPVKIMNGVLAIAAGEYHTLILKTDNTLWATGKNTYGQLGDGTTLDKNIPVKIMDNITGMAAGLEHSLFIKRPYGLYAAGLNTSGQLGDGTTTNRNTPVFIKDSVKDVSSSNLTSFMLNFNQTLWATGENTLGQLGDGTSTQRNTPVKIMDNVQQIAAGAFHSILYKTNTTAPWSVGQNNLGQLGNGNNLNKVIWDQVVLP